MQKLKAVTENDMEKAAREQEIASLKLSRTEIAARVRVLRKELEAAKQRYDGALFDNFTNGIPQSLDVVDVNREPYGAVYYLSPLLHRVIEKQDDKPVLHVSNDIFDLYYWSTQTTFEIGMLAGAIYADCPSATIDRFERGLVTALTACSWIVKEEERL